MRFVLEFALVRRQERFSTGGGRGGILLALLCFRGTRLRGLAWEGPEEGRRSGLGDAEMAVRWWVSGELETIERRGTEREMYLFLLAYRAVLHIVLEVMLTY